MLCVFCSGRFVSAAMAHVSDCAVAVRCAANCELCGRLRCVVSSACFAECSRWSRASQLGPHKFPYVAPANSKEHEVQVTATRRGGRVGRACGTAGPRTSLSDGRENFPSEEPNEHESNSPRKARRPARGERLRFLEPERRRKSPTGADRDWEPARNVDQPPPFR